MGANNISKVIGYIPGLNVIVGIVRIILMLQNNSATPEKQAIIARHIYRGMAEICLGPLLLIPDIVQTIRDQCVVQDFKSSHPGVLPT